MKRMKIEEIGKGLKKSGYASTDEINYAVSACVNQNIPLIIEGDPGVGKTALSKAVAKMTGLDFLRVQFYEGLTQDKILYDYDYQKQLLMMTAIKTSIDERIQGKTPKEALKVMKKEDIDFYGEEFLIKRPVLESLCGEKKYVLLLDEVDKCSEAVYEEYTRMTREEARSNRDRYVLFKINAKGDVYFFAQFEGNTYMQPIGRLDHEALFSGMKFNFSVVKDEPSFSFDYDSITRMIDQMIEKDPVKAIDEKDIPEKIKNRIAACTANDLDPILYGSNNYTNENGDPVKYRVSLKEPNTLMFSNAFMDGSVNCAAGEILELHKKREVIDFEKDIKKKLHQRAVQYAKECKWRKSGHTKRKRAPVR